jgi:hypothetical protein
VRNALNLIGYDYLIISRLLHLITLLDRKQPESYFMYTEMNTSTLDKEQTTTTGLSEPIRKSTYGVKKLLKKHC